MLIVHFNDLFDLNQIIWYLVPAAEVTGAAAAEEGCAGLALVEVAAGARGRQARRGEQVGG